MLIFQKLSGFSTLVFLRSARNFSSRRPRKKSFSTATQIQCSTRPNLSTNLTSPFRASWTSSVSTMAETGLTGGTEFSTCTPEHLISDVSVKSRPGITPRSSSISRRRAVTWRAREISSTPIWEPSPPNCFQMISAGQSF